MNVKNVTVLKKIVFLLIVTLILVFISDIFLDRKIADFTYSHNLQSFYIFKWLTYISPILVYIALLSIILLTIKNVFINDITSSEKNIYIISINLIITILIKDTLKIVFGRYWPSTWVNNNPSWIANHAYGFHFFHNGLAYTSFPSGHTTVVFAVASMAWILYPKLRWLCVLITSAVCIGLLGMCYHFLSDIIAGAALGITTGIIATSFVVNSISV